MAGDRYVIAGDIAQGGEGPDGRATASPEERASFTAWTIGPDDDPFDGLQYAPDLDALRDRVRALYGNDAWPRLLSRALSGPATGPVLKELAHWLKSHHAGLDPDPTAYPYISRAAGGAAKTRTTRARRRNARP